MKKLMMVLLALCMFTGTALPSHAHNRAGLIKITLDADTLNENHIAYYFEAKVASRQDEDGKVNRFFVWSFDKIDTVGDKANIEVTIIDQRTNKKSKETLYLARNTDGSWNHVDVEGKVITASIYTMVEPPDYTIYYQLGGLVLAVCVLGAALFFMIRLRKKKQSEQAK